MRSFMFDDYGQDHILQLLEVSSHGERIHRSQSEDFNSLASHRISCNIVQLS